MSVDKIQELVNSMAPREAASALALILKDLFSLLDEDTRIQFVTDLIDDTGDDKVSSMVHL